MSAGTLASFVVQALQVIQQTISNGIFFSFGITILTTSSRLLFEKLTVAKLLTDSKDQYSVPEAHHYTHMLSQMNPAYTPRPLISRYILIVSFPGVCPLQVLRPNCCITPYLWQCTLCNDHTLFV